MFVTIEGIDNVGKTSICKSLERSLSRDYTVTLVSDPPRIPPWKSLKELILADKNVTPIARALTLLAARIDSYSRTIQPALQKGHFVLADRFTDSWLAYQGAVARKYFKSARGAIGFFQSVNNQFVKNGLVAMPDRTFLIIADPAEVIKRGKEKKASVYDSLQVQRMVQENYLTIARKARARIEIIDSNGRTVEQLTESLEARVRRFLRAKG